MNTSESSSNSVTPTSRRLGCSLFILAWLLLNFLCGIATLFGLAAAGSNSRIYIMNADGTAPRQITRNLLFNPSVDYLGPAWSPDGTRIAFSANSTGTFDIYLMNADGTGQMQLTDNPGNDRDAAWSPDGRQIAFSSHRDGNGEIYIMNADGTQQTRLTNNPALDAGPVWSPDGSRIAFDSSRNSDPYRNLTFDIYAMNADGTQLIQLSNNSTAAAWSPNGKQIAFVSYRDGNSEIYIMNADGTQQTRLTNTSLGKEYYPNPAWSPDGKQIAFAGGDKNEIYVMNADGTQQTQLTKSPVAARDPAWSPNGKQITFVMSKNDITTYFVGVLASVIQCVFAFVSLIGLIVSLSLGLRVAPRKWPRFYRWIESHAAIRAVEPGAIAGVLAALIGLGITISSHSWSTGGFIEIVSASYFILVLAMLLIGPIVGAVGGIVGGIIANRFGGKTALIFVAAVFGGAIAGLVIGILPNALGWLTP